MSVGGKRQVLQQIDGRNGQGIPRPNIPFHSPGLGPPMLGERLQVTSPKSIPKLLRKEQDSAVKMRLTFLNFLAHSGLSFEKCCEYCGIATSTGYSWIQKWNEAGHEALKPSGNQGGRPSRLSEEQFRSLRNLLKERQQWTTREVMELIEEKFGIRYSHDQVSRILKKN